MPNEYLAGMLFHPRAAQIDHGGYVYGLTMLSNVANKVMFAGIALVNYTQGVFKTKALMDDVGRRERKEEKGHNKSQWLTIK